MKDSITVTFLKKVSKHLFKSLYFRYPGLVWDVEKWIDEGNSRAQILNILVQNGIIFDYPTPIPAIESLNKLPLESSVGTLRRYLAKIQGAMITGRDGFTVMPDGRFLIQPSWHESLVIDNPAYFKRFQKRPVYKKGIWFNALLYWAGSYYHWICEVLPRFHQVIDKLPLETKIIVPKIMEEWQWESLRAVGISRDRCVCYDGTHPWGLEELWYAPPVAMSGDHDPTSIMWVKKSILSQYGSGGIIPTKDNRVYISRSSAQLRRLENEEDLLPLLDSFGYRVVKAENLSFADQVTLFSTATHIVAPHGGGLTNIVWSRPGCRVLEIFHPQTIERRCYWTLSHALGHQHRYLIGENIRDGDPDSPFMLEKEKLQKALVAIDRE